LDFSGYPVLSQDLIGKWNHYPSPFFFGKIKLKFGDGSSPYNQSPIFQFLLFCVASHQSMQRIKADDLSSYLEIFFWMT
jgi:hypothetical protein